MREIWSLLGATVRDWYEDRAQRLGAALAYYMIFALAPGLIIVIAVAGLLLGLDAEVQIVGREDPSQAGEPAEARALTTSSDEIPGSVRPSRPLRLSQCR